MGELSYSAVLSAIGATARIAKMLKPTIFCFHSVRGTQPKGNASSLSVSASFLEDMIETLGTLSIPIIPLDEAHRRIRARDMRPFVVLTFDDGYRDNYTILYPLMLKHRTPFTIFVTTGLLDETVPMWWDVIERLHHLGGNLALDEIGSAEPRDTRANPIAALTACFRNASPSLQARMVAQLRTRNPDIDLGGATLSWAMLAEMQRSGLLTVGSHAMHHPLLSRLSQAEVNDEVLGSRQRIQEMLGTAPAFLAYPFGQHWEVGRWAAEAAKQAGYTAAFTTEAVPLSADDADRPFSTPRVLLSRKADHPDIALAYMSGLPSRMNQLVGRS